MAIKLHRKGIALDRNERIKEDENITMIENELNKVGTALPEAQAAKALSEEAKAQAEGVQTQLNEIVVNGDSSVEAAQARVRSDGTVAATLKERLDVEHQGITAQLEKKVGGGKKATPEDINDDLMALVTGNGTVNVLSEPAPNSVTIEKFHPDIQSKLAAIINAMVPEGTPLGGDQQ